MLNARLMTGKLFPAAKMHEPSILTRWTARKDLHARREGSGLRLRRLGRVARGTGAAFGHKLGGLRAVLGKAQPLQEVLKLGLLVFKPAQRLGAIIVEGAIAAGRWSAPPIPATCAFH